MTPRQKSAPVSAAAHTALACLLAAMAFASSLVTGPSPVAAQPPMNSGGGWTSYPDPNVNTGIPGQYATGEIDMNPSSFNSLTAIAAAFNNARTIENADICSGGTCETGAAVMPTTLTFPADYSTWTPSEKGLWLLNQERTARGLLPFAGTDPAVTTVAQNWAQNLLDTDSFFHNPDAESHVAAACTGCIGNFGSVAENLYMRNAFAFPNPAVLDAFGVERAIYGWMYVDRTDNGSSPDQEWGHRHALLWNNMTNDNGSATSEGYIGFGVAKKPITQGQFVGESEVVVWNAIDSNGSYPATQSDLTLLANPCRIYESSSASGGLTGALDGGESRTIQVTGALTGQGASSNCVPAGASSVIVSVAAVNPQAAGNLRLVAAGGAPPSGGVVNYASNGLDNSNTVTVGLSAGGAVDVSANGGVAGAGLVSTNVRLSVVGYYGSGSLTFFPVTPCTVADSRVNQGASGAFDGPFGAGAAYPDVDVVGSFSSTQGGGNTTCGVPASADGVVLNLVAVNAAGGRGHLSIGTGGTEPTEPNTAFAPIPMNNAALAYVPLGAAGTVAVNITGLSGTPTTEIRMVVVGYLDATTAGASYTAVTPCAAFDTRPSEGAGSSLAGARDGGSSTTYQVSGNALAAVQGGGHGGSCGVPTGASAVLINLVAVNPAAAGNLQAAAAGSAPTGGLLNFNSLVPAMNNSNAVVVPLSGSGQIAVTVNTGATNIVDATDIRGVVLGYYSSPLLS